MRLSICIVAGLLVTVSALGAAPELWLYYHRNLLLDETMTDLEAVWKRAGAAGYRKVLLADWKFGHLGKLGTDTEKYFQHVARVRQIARENNLEIVPAIFNIGYSNSMLANDPNLAEGLPVRNALFVVKDGEARLVADPPVSLASKPDVQDKAYRESEAVITTRGHSGNARLGWNLKLSPFRCYHVSVKVRTAGYTGEFEIKPIGGNGRLLSYTKSFVKPTQDWAEHHIVFGSLDQEGVTLYMGVWGDAKGELQIRDWSIGEVGPVNLLRRPGAPLVVDGYEEGKDFEPVADPKLGVVPVPGDYSIWHEPPVIRTKLPDGTKLRVSWYFAVIINNDQVCSCPSEPKLLELLVDEAKRNLEAWEPRGLMMSHDEVRALNWDRSCRDRGLTPAQIMADNAAYCARLLPHHELYVWSDMFDPNHNAVEQFHLVNGDLRGSWEGLDPRITIVNWNFEERDRSLAHFAKRGHKQVLAAYYDGPVERVRDWIRSAKRVNGVTGVMYTTWERKYDDLERFAEMVKAEWK